MLVRCPSCQTSVWATAAKPCPSCRKPMPEAILVAAAAAAPPRPAAPVRPTTSACHDIPLCRAEESAKQRSASTAVAPQANRTIRRTSWGAVITGLLFMLGGAWMFTLTAEDSSFEGVRMSRRARQMERMLGETGTEIVCALAGLGIGLGLIVTSRRDMAVASANEQTQQADDGTCCFRKKQTPDATKAFLFILGGHARPIAFRCHACDACRQQSRSVGRRFWLFVTLAPFAAFSALPLLIVTPFVLFSRTDPKPGAAMYLGVTFAAAVFFTSACYILNRQMRSRTESLLGPRLEPVVRSLARINKWGWPKRIALTNECDAKLPIIDLA
jgi:hypothetical protein